MTRLPRSLSRVSPLRPFVASAVMLCSVLIAADVRAQDARIVDPPSVDPPSQDAAVVEAPAHVSLVEGTVILERDGKPDTSPASMPLLAGDRLRAQNGRAEVLFADGSTLHLDSNTVVDFQSDAVIRLLEGRVRLSISGRNRDVSYRVDAPAAWVQIEEAGEYRVSALRGDRDLEVELAVIRGAAELVNEDGRSLLRAGERAFARNGNAPSAPYVFNSAAWDAFDQWSEARRAERLGATAEYLPEEVRPYSATFATYGAWRHEPTYGHVWYPTVRAGWRPYYHGRWARLRPWGWTWIGADPWAWPTHHYGRWGFSAGLWFWIPGPTWGPAWVSWAYAPGYVSWCPLGWNNRPLFGFNVNIFGGRHYDPWHAWTVVPHGRFGRGFVNVNVVNATHIDARTRGAFVVRDRDRGPVVTGYAVPRSSAPIRVAGGRLRDPRAASGVRSYQADPRTGSPDAGAAFRSRRPSGAPLTGPGLPAPSREPREPSAIRTPGPQNAVPSRSRSRSAGVPDDTGGFERRAIPRSGGSVAPDASPSPSYRRSAPENRAVPSAPRRSDESIQQDSGVERSRAIPRQPETPRSTPNPQPDYTRRPPSDYGRRAPDTQPDTSYRRAMPRSSPESGPPAGYSAPERRSAPEARPSSPPPSAAPARPSGGGESRSAGPPRSSGGDQGHSRGGQPSTGTAVRRPGGRR